MSQVEDVTPNVKWIGALDVDISVFDIVMETEFGTTYNAYLVQTNEGSVLIETVKESFFDGYIEKLRSILGDLGKIKYLITNHTEPDHSGSIKKMIDLLPSLTVIGSKTAIAYLKEIVNGPFNYRSAEDLAKLEFGGKTFEFISVPFLHWPDSMYTYLHQDRILFTCDSFGAHFSPKDSIMISKLPKNREEDYQKALLYYYTAIFGPFKEYVLKAYDKIINLEIDFICNGHGPILDSGVKETIETYKNWSTSTKEKKAKKVVMVYASAYGYTTEVGEEIEKGLLMVNEELDFKKYMVDIKNYSDLKRSIMDDILDADGVILGTDTINGDAVPPIWDIALSMSPYVHCGKIMTAFGSYGWSGEGVDNIVSRLNHLRGQVLDGFKVKFRMSEKEKKDAKTFGKLYGKCIYTGNVPTKPKQRAVTANNWEELNPTGKVVLWRCIICGEIFAGVMPPLSCPACGVGQDLFELYTPEEITVHSDMPLKFVIIGSGIAAVSAAEAVRSRNAAGGILIISNEDRPPYYRPIVAEILEKQHNEEEFFLRRDIWYKENNVDLKLGTDVLSIDKENRKILTSTESIEYDKLIIATGAKPFIPPIGGKDLEGVIAIRSAKDCDRLKAIVKGAKSAVVIGGGVLGIEISYLLKNIGLNVTIAECASRLMSRQLDEESSKYIAEKVTEYGIKLMFLANSNIIGHEGKVTGVSISGETIPCEIVIVNAGIRSNKELAENAGILCGRGINVNNKMETSCPNIYAAGDVAYLDDFNQGLWAPSMEMGRIAGANAAGDNKTFSFGLEPVTMMTANFELMSIGNLPKNNDDDEHSMYCHHEPINERTLNLCFVNGKIEFAATFNMNHRAAQIISSVREGRTISKTISSIFE